MFIVEKLKKEQLLDIFGEVVVELQSLFQEPQTLSDDEKLFLENRLLFLQMEYNRLVTRHEKRTPKLPISHVRNGRSVPQPPN
jgi:hypothetical protein